MNQEKKGTVALIIRDGWGISPNPADAEKVGDATVLAKKPIEDMLKANYPTATLQAAEEAVGVPIGQMGNSEVGHLNLGAGRIVQQDINRITLSIRDRSFFSNPELVKIMSTVKEKGSTLHLMGLCSDGGVHSHINHLIALIEMAKEQNIDNVLIHMMTDGRDTSPTNGVKYAKQIEEAIQRVGVGKIATVTGRYYIMDRDKRWERTSLAYNAIVNAKGELAADAVSAIQKSYDNEVTDEFIKPFIIAANDDEAKNCTIKDNDAVIFFNFRRDRTRQITTMLMDETFKDAETPNRPTVDFLCMTEYDETYGLPIAFPPVKMTKLFGQVLAEHGKTQLRCAETEKYPHVTFFFNGGIEEPNKGEDRYMQPSPKVATYDLQPEMSAYELTENVIERIKDNKYDVLILNFANPDMVGHTGDIKAVTKAVEVTDECVGKVLECIDSINGCALVTADHGNAENMIDAEGGPQTAHTTNLVHIFYYGKDHADINLKSGKLADVAPTMLKLLGLPQPEEMTGESLV